jgi:DNA-binding CsgD family transcriptional regulator
MDLAYEVGAAGSMHELRLGVASGLAALVGATLTSFTEIDTASGIVRATSDPASEDLTETEAELGRLAHEHPLVSRSPHEDRAETITDYMSRRAFRKTELYACVYRSLEAGDQLAVNLPGMPGTAVGVALNRPRPTFTPRDRSLLELARPLLARACRELTARDAGRDGREPVLSPTAEQTEALTVREREVLELVRIGCANARIARELRISRRTVENHLRAVYRKLDVPNRTAAVAAIWVENPRGDGRRRS